MSPSRICSAVVPLALAAAISARAQTTAPKPAPRGALDAGPPPARRPESDQEVIDSLELLRNLEVLRDLEMYAPADAGPRTSETSPP